MPEMIAMSEADADALADWCESWNWRHLTPTLAMVESSAGFAIPLSWVRDKLPGAILAEALAAFIGEE